MRQLFAVFMGACVLVGLFVPAMYIKYEGDLPPLDTRADVLRTLKVYIEGQRQQALAGIDPTRIEAFEMITKENTPEGILMGALSTEGCPDYFSYPKEDGPTWASRLINFGAGNGTGGPGPGRCELRFSDRLADSLGLPTGVHRAIAIYKFHASLSKQELLQLELSARYFGPGILGVKSAAKRLFGKDPSKLSLAESAELLMAEGNYDMILHCKEPSKLRTWRNNVIDAMAGFNLVKREAADQAKTQKLFCLSRPE
jgi:hypothetical protein